MPILPSKSSVTGITTNRLRLLTGGGKAVLSAIAIAFLAGCAWTDLTVVLLKGCQVGLTGL